MAPPVLCPDRVVGSGLGWRGPWRGLLLAATAAGVTGCASMRSGGVSLPGEFRPADVRQALVAHLDQQTLPLWTSPELVDGLHGGFLNLLDRDGRVVGQEVKPLIAHLRLLFLHAVAIARCGSEVERARLRRQYEAGLAFLEERFWDKTAGGWLYELTAEGYVHDNSKRMVCQVYAIYILSELNRILGDPKTLALAAETFDYIEVGGWDQTHGGYRNDCTLPASAPANSDKDVGTNFHAMLALASLYRASPKPVYRERLETLFRLITTRCVCPGSGNVYTRLGVDWQPLAGSKPREEATLYGHSVELIWYALATAEVLGRDPGELRSWAEQAAAAFVRDGMHPNGATYLLGFLDGQATDKRVTFWGQAEAMILFLRLYELTGDRRYYGLFETVTRWTFEHIVSPRSGLWTPVADVNGRPIGAHPGGTYWKAGFHVTRMLLEAERILGRLSESGSAGERH